MAQVWPASDTFDHGTPVYGSEVIGYLGLRPDSGSYGRGRIHDGYGAGTAALIRGDPGDVTAGVMRRQLFVADVDVAATIRLHAVSGPATVAHFTRAGVVARIQGGTLAADGTPEIRHEDVDGYGFTAELLPPNQLRFRLVRWNAGTETVLGTSDQSAADYGHMLSDTTLILVCEQSGGDVILTGKVSQVGLADPLAASIYQPGGPGGTQSSGSGAPGGPAPSVGTVLTPPADGGAVGKGWIKPKDSVPVLTVTDTGGSVITGLGRCGWLADVEQSHDSGAVTTVALCSALVVTDTSGDSTVVWRDEFARATPALAESVTDALGTTGRNLGSDWTTDAASIATDVLARDTTDEAASVGVQAPGATDVVPVWHQRPVDDVASHDFSVRIRPTSSASIGSVLVRGNPTGTATVWDSYRLDVTPGTPATIDLQRVIAGTPTLLASQDTGGTPIDVAINAYTELRLEVEQDPLGGPGGAVLLRAWVGGVLVVWVATDPPTTGAAVNLNGDVVDVGQARILTGNAVGWGTLVDTSASRVDDWTDEATTAPDPQPSDLPSVALPAEDDGVTGDLDDACPVEWPIEPEHVGPKVGREFDSGHREHLALATYEPRAYRSSAVMTPAEWSTFQAFWDDHDGATVPFNWDPSTRWPWEQAGVFAFVDGSLRSERMGGRNYAVSFEIEECRATP